MNKSEFKSLLKGIPTIEVCLNWSHDEGSGTFEREFKHNSYNIITSFECFQSGFFEDIGFFTSPRFVTHQLCINYIESNVYDNEGEEIKLTNNQYDLLSKKIKYNIISI